MACASPPAGQIDAAGGNNVLQSQASLPPRRQQVRQARLAHAGWSAKHERIERQMLGSRGRCERPHHRILGPRNENASALSSRPTPGGPGAYSAEEKGSEKRPLIKANPLCNWASVELQIPGSFRAVILPEFALPYDTAKAVFIPIYLIVSA
jgi:hypothetical protein